MAAGPWILTDHAKEAIFTDMNLATDTFRCVLFLSTSNLGTGSTTYAAVTNEVATANGYTQNSEAATVTVALSGTTVTIDETANPSWTASGGSITAHYAALYNVTTGDILCYCLLDDTPADVTATDGNDLTVNQNASGIGTFSIPNS